MSKVDECFAMRDVRTSSLWVIKSGNEFVSAYYQVLLNKFDGPAWVSNINEAMHFDSEYAANVYISHVMCGQRD